jgi:hypothetical protein
VKFLSRIIDDLLLLAGCACILRGLALWNPVVTWIAAGTMLIGFAYLIGKAKAKNANQ